MSTPSASQTVSTPSSTRERWKIELLRSYTNIGDLLKHQLITAHEAQNLEQIADRFQIRITPYYAQLIQPDPHCPIRQQAIPALSEQDPALPSWAIELSQQIYHRPVPWIADAIGDLQNLATPRLTHRYQNRAIVHTSSLCALYCRFCFRKSHLNADDSPLYEGSFEPTLLYLKNHPEIRELILTGGDPLSVTDASLDRFFTQLTQIPHLKTVRIHTRMAVTLPCRFTADLLEILSRQWPFQIVLVNHFNHPLELTRDACQALSSLKKIGISLLNQSVLLKGVNDNLDCLAELFQSLYEHGTLPFYLHYPDWTPGTFHFRPGIEKAKLLIRQLQGRVSGPALPSLVLDIPQGAGKVSILDRLQLVQSMDSTQGLQGNVYKITSPPHTRSERPHQNLADHLYLDLFQT